MHPAQIVTDFYGRVIKLINFMRHWCFFYSFILLKNYYLTNKYLLLYNYMVTLLKRLFEIIH